MAHELQSKDIGDKRTANQWIKALNARAGHIISAKKF